MQSFKYFGIIKECNNITIFVSLSKLVNLQNPILSVLDGTSLYSDKNRSKLLCNKPISHVVLSPAKLSKDICTTLKFLPDTYVYIYMYVEKVKKKTRPCVLKRDASNRSNSDGSSSAENFCCFLHFFYRNPSFFHLSIIHLSNLSDYVDLI